MDVEERMQSLWSLLRSRRCIPDILRHRELDGRSFGVYSISTIVGVEDIDDINVTDSDKKDCNIKDIAVLPDNTLVAIDRCAIKVIDTKRGRVVSKKQMEHPEYITMITFNIVAISQPKEQKIVFAKLNSEIVIYKTMQFKRKKFINGISYHKGNLIVASNSVVEVRDLDGNLLRKVIDVWHGPKQVATSPGHDLFCVCAIKRVIITRLNGGGNTIAEFDNDYPPMKRATVDRQGNVYVSNSRTHSLHQVRAGSNKMIPLLPDGTFIRKEPQCITYSDAENRFYVWLHWSKTIKVYSGVYGLNV